MKHSVSKYWQQTYVNYRLLTNPSVPLSFLLAKAKAVIYGWKTNLLAKCFASCGALRYALCFYGSDSLSEEHKNILKCFVFATISLVLMFYCQQGGQCELEVVGKKGMVYLNGRTISAGTKVPLTGGDEVVFSSCRQAYVSYHHFLFVQSCNFMYLILHYCNYIQ